MGKRSDFERVGRDFYPTPMAAVQPLIPHLPEGFSYWEPCAGDGALIDHLAKLADIHYCGLMYQTHQAGYEMTPQPAVVQAKFWNAQTFKSVLYAFRMAVISCNCHLAPTCASGEFRASGLGHKGDWCV